MILMKTPTLSPWDKVQLARHPRRPHTLDYVRALCDDFIELHGDRRYGDDAAMVGGLARFAHRTIVIVGHQKGATHARMCGATLAWRVQKDTARRCVCFASPRSLAFR